MGVLRGLVVALASLWALSGCQEKIKEQEEDTAAASADGAGVSKGEVAAAADLPPDKGVAADSEPETALDAEPTSEVAPEVAPDVVEGESSIDSEGIAAPEVATVADIVADTVDVAVAPDTPVDSGPTACAQDCATLSFGTPCLVGACENGVCVGKPVSKPTTCNDANDCTSGDTCCLPGDAFCKAGTCKSGSNTCECQGADPAECEGLKGDGNACNGLLYCDTSALPFQCKPLPQSEVVCPVAPSPCLQIACQPATGLCATKVVKEGEFCPSADPCTKNQCVAGVCVVETKTCECASNADCAGKDDADLCNGNTYCDKSIAGKNTCKINPASVVSCSTDADTACAKNVCIASTGLCQVTPAELVDCQTGTCKPLLPGQSPKTNLNCEDGNKCTIGDQCGGGACKPGTQTCSCSSTADCASQDDGDPCNGTLYCDKAAGKCKLNPATVVYCPPSGSFCTKNVCKPIPGAPGQGACAIENANEGIPCNDGVLCTAGDHCEKGVCAPTANVCLCEKDTDCAKAEDGDLCNGTLLCDLSQAAPKCVVNPATVIACDAPGNPCAQTTCEKATGTCKTALKPDGAACDYDGTPCTAFDGCQGGQCKPGPQICACQGAADCAKFEDGDLCNGTLYCDAVAATCKVNPATVPQCPVTLNPCAISSCDKASGVCKFVPLGDGEPCDADGSLCTPGDVCSGGKCVAGANLCGCLKDVDCAAKEDGNVCNGTLYCEKSNGPAHCAIKPASAVTCTADDNPCTEVACDPKTGKCSNPPVLDGKVCEDGKPCTLGDSCVAGKCLAGLNACNCKTSVDCIDDGNPCNGTASCEKGQCTTTPAIACSTEVKGCDAQQCDAKTGLCAPTLKACDDANPCTVDSCDPKVGGCVGKAYGDGTACGPGLACVASACTNVPR